MVVDQVSHLGILEMLVKPNIPTPKSHTPSRPGSWERGKGVSVFGSTRSLDVHWRDIRPQVVQYDLEYRYLPSATCGIAPRDIFQKERKTVFFSCVSVALTISGSQVFGVQAVSETQICYPFPPCTAQREFGRVDE